MKGDHRIKVKFEVKIIPETDGTFNCFVEEYNIGFCATTEEEIQRKAEFMIKSQLRNNTLHHTIF